MPAGSGEDLARTEDPDAARLMALYLFTCPSANMVGLYYLPIPLMAMQLQWDEAKVRHALAIVRRAGVAEYDERRQLVWIPNGAKYQLGPTLKPKNNTRKTVARQVRAFEGHPFFDAFLSLYLKPYHLADLFPNWIKPVSPQNSPPGGVHDGSGTGGGGVHPAPAPVPVRSEEEGTRAPAQPPPPDPPSAAPGADPLAAEFADAIRAQPGLADIRDKHESAEAILGEMATAGWRREWVLAAIAKAGADARTERAAEGHLEAATVGKILMARVRRCRDIWTQRQRDLASNPDARAEQRRARERADAAAESVPDALSRAETARRAREVLGERLTPKAARRRPAKKVS